MNKEMIISAGDQETRVAILEDDQVVEVFICLLYTSDAADD